MKMTPDLEACGTSAFGYWMENLKTTTENPQFFLIHKFNEFVKFSSHMNKCDICFITPTRIHCVC